MAVKHMILPWPPSILSPNARANVWAKARAGKKYRVDCYIVALAAGIKAPGGTGKFTIRFDYYPPDRRRRDDDNAIAAFKQGRDGLAQAMGCDDSRFASVHHLHDNPRGCVLVTID